MKGFGDSQTWRQDFSYDRYGNRNFTEGNTTFSGFDKLCNGNTELCTDLKKRLNPSVNAASNRLSTDDGYSFDPSGNTTADPDGRTFIYDGENKQVEVKDASNNVIGQYFYNGDGQRLKKIIPSTGETTVFVYDAAGKLVAEYSTIIEPSSSAKVAYLTNDHLGSPRINTDQNGNVTARHDYHPFGEEIDTPERTINHGYANDSIEQKFTGKRRDSESGLDFFEARYYSSTLGRFFNPDEFTGGPDELFDFAETASENPTFYADLTGPQSLNKYQYVYNAPFRYVDLDGHEAEETDCPVCIETVRPIVRPIAKTGVEVEKIATDASTWGDPVSVYHLPPGTMMRDDGAIVDESNGQVLRPSPYTGVRGAAREGSGLRAQPQAKPQPSMNKASNSSSSKTKGLERQVKKHQEKLTKYARDPYKNDNKGILRNSPRSRHPEVISRRVRNLVRQIRNFQKQVEKIKKDGN